MSKFPLILFLFFLYRLVNAQSFSLEQIMSAPFPSELTAAPSGNKVAFVMNQQGSRNIFLAEGPDFQPTRLTDYNGDNGQEITSLQFSHDAKTLVFLRGGGPNKAGELPNPALITNGVERALFSLELQGKKIRKIGNGISPSVSPDDTWVAFLAGGQVWTASLRDTTIKPARLFQIRGSQGQLRWSPDGKKLAFVSNRGDHSFIGVYDLFHKEVTFLNPSVDKDSNPVWSPDGKEIAFIRVPALRDALIFEPHRESQPWSIVVAEVDGSKFSVAWQAAPGRGSAFFGGGLVAENLLFWTADNYLIFPYEGDGWHHLYAVAPSGGAARLLTPGEGEVEYAVFSSDKKSVWFNANIGDIDRRHLWQVDGKGTLRQITSGKGIEWMPAPLADGTLLCLRSDAFLPARPAVVKNGQLHDISPQSSLADFPASHLVEPLPVKITAADGMVVPGQLFLPKNHKPGEKHPAAIFFHGGSRRQMLLGFNYGSYYHNAYALNQYLASQGYVVLSVNYRSGIGYGMEFREALHYGATGAAEFNDVVGAGLFLKNRDDVDGNRIGLWGGSYGGYLTAMGLSRAPDLFAAGVDIHGVHDWNEAVKNFIPTYDPSKRPEWAKLAYESSPMPYVHQWKAPVLLIHADDDRNVPFSETVTLVEQLRKNKVYFEQLIFPDDVHGFLLHRNWLSAYQGTADFFDRFVKHKK